MRGRKGCIMETAKATAAAPAAEEGLQQAVKHDPAVETAEEATEPAEADINELCKDMFNKMAVYLTGELTATSEDYKLLENMNKLTSLKYLEMKDIAINISRNLKDLNQKYAGLQPYLEQINLIEEQVAALEQAAYKLDAYSKKLGRYLSNSFPHVLLWQQFSQASNTVVLNLWVPVGVLAYNSQKSKPVYQLLEFLGVEGQKYLGLHDVIQ
uniref:Biosis of lysosomal organelles complex 1 subunit 2 n=1 Tax=Anolis carolinensis TaxID=28377 RepID=H9G436_ANOCA